MLRFLVFLLFFTISHIVSATNIQHQGNTATLVETQPSGHVNISIAPPNRDISYNAFSRFDVSNNGATFLNGTANARTIVAEIFSSNPSRIEGPINVDGPRANLIFANQNGITVNGGSFINFGSVALTTGGVSFQDIGTSRYVNVNTNSGTIEIGPEGLAATLVRLELIAKQIRIAGFVDNDWSSSTAATRLVAGSSEALFDTAASPTDNLTPWVYYSGGGKTHDVAIDVSVNGKITSGRVDLVVTDEGAGVQNSGILQASMGNFSLSSAGDVIQKGSFLAAGDMSITSHHFSQEGNDAQLLSYGHVELRASGDVLNQGSIQAGAEATSDPENLPAIKIVADGSFENQGLSDSETGAIIFASAGDILIQAESIKNSNSRIISNEFLQLTASNDVVNESRRVAGAGDASWSNRNHNWLGWPTQDQGYSLDFGFLENPSALAYLISRSGTEIRAHNVQNIGGLINVNQGNLDISAQDTFSNHATIVGRVSYRNHCRFLICRRSANANVNIVGGQLNVDGILSISAQNRIENIGGLAFATSDIVLDAPSVLAQADQIYFALNRSKGIKALFGDTWGRVYVMDAGGVFETTEGTIKLSGDGFVEGGAFLANSVDGNIVTIRTPSRETATLENHLGITSWWWR
jgi:filamentous hemagglutinin family protein